MRNGGAVAYLEEKFAEYVGAKYAIALCNGTATLHTALMAAGLTDTGVQTTPLTMSAPSAAILHAGCTPAYVDVDPNTWLAPARHMPVSLYGAHNEVAAIVDDAAQTLRPHGGSVFTSYSFQASKILAAGEGGMLVTNDEAMATMARSVSSLGYPMAADQPRIDPAVIKGSDYERHPRLGWNYRMADVVAKEVDRELGMADILRRQRALAAFYYRDAVRGRHWIKPQAYTLGAHDWWTFAVAVDTAERAALLSEQVVAMGGEKPYGAWRLSYDEPAFDAYRASCPVAEDLQPRLLQFQTNEERAANRNARALLAAINVVEGQR